MRQHKYYISLSILIISVFLFSACSNGGSSTTSAALPEDEFYNLSEDFTYACDELNTYITDAENLLGTISDADINEETIAPAYAELSEVLEKARAAVSSSVPESAASDEEEIRQQIQKIQEQNDTIRSICYDLENAISYLEQCQQELTEYKKSIQVIPEQAYTGIAETANGYKAEYTVYVTNWIRASDTDTLQVAWENAGGKDTVPSIDNFHESTNDGFSTENAAIAFGKVSFRNVTDGFDITESNPISFTVPLLQSKDMPGGYVNAKAYIGYKEPKYVRMDNHSYNSYINPYMKSNTWGPVVLMFVFPNAFTPNNPNGHPELDGFKIHFDNAYSDSEKYISISLPSDSELMNSDNTR